MSRAQNDTYLQIKHFFNSYIFLFIEELYMAELMQRIK